MKHKLISVALIAVLVFMVLGISAACGPTTTQYDLTITSTEGGNVTMPGEGTFPYNAGTVVNLVATPDANYHFVKWTGTGTVANVNAAATIITMNGNYSITANFALVAVTYNLTITSTAGGDVTTPVEGTHTYTAGMAVNLTATPDAGYQFVNWTGDVGTIANVNAVATIITMTGNYSITANFALVAVTYNLTITSTAGGDVTTPVEGTHTYTAGMAVNLTATPDVGYQFVNWTGDVGTIANVNAAATIITMNGNYSITANFALVAVTYDLTITSTAGGDVTTPVEGTYNYAAATVVNLMATPNAGYRFVNWTTTAGTFANANAAQTTFTMPTQNVTVTAHFAFGTLINNVPDANQPPTLTLPSTILNFKNFCAPMAAANILEYWDDVANHANAQNVTAGLIPETVAEYLGWFIDTNNNGSPDRLNGADGHPGTYSKDIGPGIMDFAQWDATHPPAGPRPITAPNFTLPTGKLGYAWVSGSNCDTNYTLILNLYKNEIDNGRPLLVSFDYWNPLFGINVTDPQSGEIISVFAWGNYTSGSSSPNPDEVWTYGLIGHAVTGVGYILNWDPDGMGGLPLTDYVIVHDNWPTTPKNVAIPLANWMCLVAVNP